MKYLLRLLVLGTLAFVSASAATDIRPVPPQAASRYATVQVRVTPNHADWSYHCGDKATFRVTVTADNTDIPDAKVKISFGPELMPTTDKELVVPVGGVEVDAGTLKEPGFLRLAATTEFLGRNYRGLATASFDPEKIQPTQTEPADFDAFWTSAKAELAAVPIDARMTLMPEACTANVNVYHVSFRVPGGSWETGSRFFGILCEPVKPGKYPALLRVPGAGIRPYKGDVAVAEKGAITLEVGVHGIPVNMEKSVYDQLYAGGLNGYWNFNLDDKQSFYYRRVIQGCLRSNDFLTSRPQWDGKTLVVAGASQGGMLTIATAALDPRVTALAATHPAFCDVSGDLHGRASGWPHPFKPDFKTGAPSLHATPAKIDTVRYYDVVNFAKRVKAPGFYTWGYNDETCPPTSMYAAYNVITAHKELALALEQGHSYPPEQYEAILRFLTQVMELK